MIKIPIAVIIGTRPEAVKMAPLILELKKRDVFSTVLYTSGQHGYMLDEVLDFFGIESDRVKGEQLNRRDLLGMHLDIASDIGEFLAKEKPRCVFVHGDTATAFAASCAAALMKIPLIHIEAGLRSYDKSEPYPEEIFRRFISAAADIHFAPTENSAENLMKEGIGRDRIFVTGNTVIDALRYTVDPNYAPPFGLDDYFIVTLHRRESVGEPMRNILRALRDALKDMPDIKAVFPVHPNPRVKNEVISELSGVKNLILTDHLGVYEFHNLLARCRFVLTDSGGLQEEAPALGRPVLLARDVTERQEAVLSGGVIKVGRQKDAIFRGITELCKGKPREFCGVIKNPYGDGYSSARIVDSVEKIFVGS